MFSTYLAVYAAFASLCAVVFSYFALKKSRQAAMYAQSMYQYISAENKRSKTLKQLTEHEAELTDHADSIAQLNKTMKSLRSRIGMRQLRDARKENGSDIPDPKTDPAGWKAYMRAKLHLDKTGGSSK